MQRNSSNEDAQRQQELEKWFSALYTEIEDFIYGRFDVMNTAAVMCSLCKLLPRCKARSLSQFRKWVFRIVTRFTNESNIAGHKILPPVSHAPRKGVKPFHYEVHGQKAFIRLDKDNTWIVPDHWLDEARRLWPVHLRKLPDGRPYVAKKFRQRKPDGRVGQTVIPVHRLFLEAKPGEFVVTESGNYLDFTDVRIREPLTSRDIWDLGKRLSFDDLSNRFPSPDLTTGLILMQARPTRPPGAGPDEDDRDDWLHHSFNEGMNRA